MAVYMLVGMTRAGGASGVFPWLLVSLSMFVYGTQRPLWKTGLALHANKRFKTRTETRAPTMGALVSVFISQPLHGLEIWPQKSG